jgi:hypothetical protein
MHAAKKCQVAFLRSVRRLLVTANVPSSPILVTPMKEALSSTQTSVLTRATRRNIPEDAILQYVNTTWNSVSRWIASWYRVLIACSREVVLSNVWSVRCRESNTPCCNYLHIASWLNKLTKIYEEWCLLGSVLTRATRRNNPEDTILQGTVMFIVSLGPEIFCSLREHDKTDAQAGNMK